MPSSQSQVQRMHSSHVMETTKSGRPFLKDLNNVFSALIISLPMETHRNSSESYPDSFTTEEALANLGSLKLIRSQRTPDQKDPSKIATTTTITKFSMSKDTAKVACQTFLDAKLFENLSNPASRSFKDKSIYGLTSKGIYVIERFLSINNMNASHLKKIFSQSNKIRLFAVGRNPETDSIVLSKSNVESVFRRFAGSKPNVKNENPSSPSILTSTSLYNNLGIELEDYNFDDKIYHYTFSGIAACEWLCSYTTLISKDEARKIGTEFIRRDLIKPVGDVENDKSKNKGKIKGKNKDDKQSLPKFKYSRTAYYRILERGRKIALWKDDSSSLCSTTSTLSQLSQSNNGAEKNNQVIDNVEEKDDQVVDNVEEKDNQVVDKVEEKDNQIINNEPGNDNQVINNEPGKNIQVVNNGESKESNIKKLQQILEDPKLCSLFMDFSKANLCEENLSFLLQVEKFKITYSININVNNNDLISDAFQIYYTYLAPASPHELNIDFNLRQSMTQYMFSIASKNSSTLKSHTRSSSLPISNQLFDKIQEVIYRLTAIDSVPKFIKTKEYLTYLLNKDFNDDSKDDSKDDNSKDDSKDDNSKDDSKDNDSKDDPKDDNLKDDSKDDNSIDDSTNNSKDDSKDNDSKDDPKDDPKDDNSIDDSKDDNSIDDSKDNSKDYSKDNDSIDDSKDDPKDDNSKDVSKDDDSVDDSTNNSKDVSIDDYSTE